jgi:hypothetical protein
MNDEELRSRHVEAFIGVSSTESVDADEEPSFQLALDRAARLASEAGHVGRTFNVSIRVVPEAHNQWIKTFSVMLTPGS